METFLRRNFKVKGNVLALYKPLDTQYTKLIAGIEVQLWHKAPMTKIFLGKTFTDDAGDFVVEFEVDSPAAYIVDGKITDVFIEAYYNGVKLEEPAAPDLLKGLVAYWKLDETTGSIAADATGNGHVGTLTGATVPDWASGKINNGLVFYGSAAGTTQSYMEVSSTDDFDFGTGDFTYAFWMKLNTNPTVACTIIDTGYGSSNFFYCEYAITGHVKIYTDSDSYSKVYVFTTGVWTHVVLRRRGNQLECLIDKVSLGKKDSNKVIKCPSPTFRFGRAMVALQNFDGMLDEIGIWKGHGLTDEEIALLYNNSTGRQYPF